MFETMKLAQRIVLQYYRHKFQTLSLLSPRLAAEHAFRLFCTPYTRKRKLVAPPIFEKAEKLSLTVNNQQITGFSWKAYPPANGKSILLCHGFDSFSYRFDHYIVPLLREGFNVFAFDAPGHGLSGGSTITVPEYCEMLYAANKQFGPFDGIMAHSFGGLAVAIAIEALAEHPAKRLVLVAPATETATAISSFFKYIPVNNRVRAEFEQLIEEKGGKPISWYSVARVMKIISTPTLWIHDKHDPVTPYSDIRSLVDQKLPHIEFELTEGLGHSLYRHSQVRKRVIEFFCGLR